MSDVMEDISASGCNLTFSRFQPCAFKDVLDSPTGVPTKMALYGVSNKHSSTYNAADKCTHDWLSPAGQLVCTMHFLRS